MKISIVICTYNPKQRIFSRVLDSIKTLENSASDILEVIVVDNNSSVPLSELDYVQKFVTDALIDVKILVEKNPGLTNARISGTKCSQGEVILFVDDDNLLESNYVFELKKAFQTYQDVSCWGPGNVTVEFSGDVDDWVDDYKSLFQQKSRSSIAYGCLKGWHSFSPAGTGLAVRKNVMIKYIEFVEEKKFNALDRTGKSLSSGGDSQIIHTSTILGKASGQLPQLRLIHLIDSEKANLDYMKNLYYMVNKSIYVHAEVFPELKHSLVRIPSRIEILSFIWSLLLKSRFKISSHKFTLPMADKLGLIAGSYQILGVKVPFQFRILKKLIKLKE